MPAVEETLETIVDKKRNIEWEVCSPEKTEGAISTRVKIYFSYPEHEKRILAAGFERAPSPQEYLSLLSDYYENKNTNHFGLDFVVRDFLEGGGFTCHAFQRIGSDLLVFENVRNLEICEPNSEKKFPFYKKPENEEYYDLKVKINVSRIKPGCTDINFVQKGSPELVRYLFGKKYAEVSKHFKDIRTAHIRIPFDKKIHPVAMRFDSYNHITVGYANYNPSRGVRELK